MSKQSCVALLGVLILAGCGSPEGQTLSKDSRDPETGRSSGEVSDFEVGDGLSRQEAGRFEELPFDGTWDVGGPCEAGTGCFLEPCGEDSDCASGWCVEHLGDAVCSQGCDGWCPDGFSCAVVDRGDGKSGAVCVSQHAALCRPCSSTSDCQAAGSQEDLCLVYGVQGSFCGDPCAQDDPCPPGYACVQATTSGGGAAFACVSVSGECGCSAKAVALSLSTPCTQKNEWGECIGLRVCGQSGLSECDAALPAQETCNGIDDDCDAQTDEQPDQGSPPANLCEDGDACTGDTCLGADGCEHAPLSGTSCDDGDVCTVNDVCSEGKCGGVPPLCDDDDPCTADGCGIDGDCVHEHNTAGCDDSDPCTIADQCAAGVCAGVPVSCDCESDSDCILLEDGDLCNGTLHCDQSKVPFQCAVLPGSPVVCEEPVGKDAICLEATCEPLTGACGLVPDHEGLACDDSNACTLGEHCILGTCETMVATNCLDGNPCTDDACEPGTGCMYTNNSLPCQDGDACTVGDVCSAGGCLPGPVKSCDDGNVCTSEVCVPAAGCVSTFAEGPCDDGNECTDGDSCNKGVCMGGAMISCDDFNLCTDDSCDIALGCTHKANQVPCDDGDPCTKPDICQDGACGGQPVDCECTQDSDCEVLEDGNACNGKLVCDKSGVPFQCAVDESTVVECPLPSGVDAQCLDAVCEPSSGVCSFAAAHEQAACEDGNACTVGDKCGSGVCLKGGPANCSDENVCTDDSCDPQTGCKHTPNGVPCQDGSACTAGDVCSGGKCTSGPPIDCNDGNECTDDSCDPAGGCKHENNAGACNDGNACTTVDTCVQGKCVGSQPPDCDDGNVCTNDGCVPGSGCTHDNNAVACSDGNACTMTDACSGGKCIGSGDLVCKDSNVCTDDKCDPAVGCVFVSNEAACDDGNACTEADVCSGGKCKGGQGKSCDDGNVCTDDECDPVSGCLHLNNTASCSDGSVCTLKDQCLDGQCKGSGALACDDGNVCTTDSCDPQSGCKHAFNAAGCNDGNVCTQGDSCSGGKCVGTLSLDCNDNNVCTTDSCQPGVGCVHSNNQAGCNDGDVCTLNDLCSAGVCQGTSPVKVCTPGAAVCSGSTATTCDTCGTGYNAGGTDCATKNQACSGGKCVPL